MLSKHVPQFQGGFEERDGLRTIHTLSRCLCDTEEPLAEGRLGGDPTHTTTRRYRLGKGVQTDNAALIIDRKVGWYEGVEEWVARRLPRW